MFVDLNVRGSVYEQWFSLVNLDCRLNGIYLYDFTYLNVAVYIPQLKPAKQLRLVNYIFVHTLY